jgi:Bacteriophage related domain of unknown function
MKYDVVTQSIQAWFATAWGTTTQVQYDNTPLEVSNLTEYVQFTIRFGESIKRSLPQGCYRQFGLVIVTVKVKPDQASQRKLNLATAAAELLLNETVQPVSPLVAPSVRMREPDLFDDTRERDGWVMAQVSCPFYYDLEY